VTDEAQPAITTSQTVESGNTVVQSVDPVTGVVTQTSISNASRETPSPHVIEEEVTEGALASDPQAGRVDEPATIETTNVRRATSVEEPAPVGQLDKAVALTRARVQSQGLFTMLHNVGSHADLDIKELAKTVESLIAALRHLV